MRCCRERLRLAPIQRTPIKGRAAMRLTPRRVGDWARAASALPAPARDATLDGTTVRRNAGRDCAGGCETGHSSPGGRSKIFFRDPPGDGPRRRLAPPSPTLPAAESVPDNGGSAPAAAPGRLPCADTAAQLATATSAALPGDNFRNSTAPGDAVAKTAARIPSTDTGASAACRRHGENRRRLALAPVASNAEVGPRELLTPDRSSLGEESCSPPPRRLSLIPTIFS